MVRWVALLTFGLSPLVAPGRRKPLQMREWQSGGGPAKQRRFFCHAAEEKLSVWKAYIAHIFYIKNLRK